MQMVLGLKVNLRRYISELRNCRKISLFLLFAVALSKVEGRGEIHMTYMNNERYLVDERRGLREKMKERLL